MAHESEHVSSSQSPSGQCGPTSASYASPDQSNSLPRRPTPALTNQIRDIEKNNNTERSRNLDSVTTSSPSNKKTKSGVLIYELKK